MQEFLAIVESGSISAAARQLNLPRATLSRRLANLEDDLGVRLILRRTNRLALTEAGEELRKRASRIVADTKAAVEALERLDDKPRGLLRVSVTGPFFGGLFDSILADFPDVQLEVMSTTRHVDLLSEGIDVAMRAGIIDDQNLIARRVHTDRLLAVAKPDYLNTFDALKSERDLQNHNCLVGFAGAWRPIGTWPLISGKTIAVSGRFAANEIEHLKCAAIAGRGIALMPTAVVSKELAEGTLVPVLPKTVGRKIPISLVYADREFIDPKVRMFVDRAVTAIQEKMPKPVEKFLLS